MKKSKYLVTLVASSLIISTTALSKNAIAPNSNFFKQYENYNKYIMPIDEIEEMLLEYTEDETVWIECNSELEHIEALEYTSGKWKLVIYASKETIAEYK